jgi:hypothetical protein
LDADLAAVIEAWPTLPAELRADILAKVQEARLDPPVTPADRP